MDYVQVPRRVKGEPEEARRARVEPVYNLPAGSEGHDVAAARVGHIDEPLMERDPRGSDEEPVCPREALYSRAVRELYEHCARLLHRETNPLLSTHFNV